jgi:hypothetical protein
VPSDLVVTKAVQPKVELAKRAELAKKVKHAKKVEHAKKVAAPRNVVLSADRSAVRSAVVVAS